MSDAVFNRLYKNLNPKQREAVDAIEGPVMVIAGPGTGKTSILTLRIANILKRTDASPDSILALTFTESGAYSMRRRLVEIMGGEAYRVGIFTFHSFANHLISRHEEAFPRIVGGRPATPADQLRILEEIFLKRRFKLIRPFGDIFYYLPKALRAIRDLKRENVSPDAFEKTLTQEARKLRKSPEGLHTRGRFRGEPRAARRQALRRIEKSKELAAVYAEYERSLARERLFDFEDMLLEAIRALREDRNLLLSLEEHYQYILADEHQDANNAQNAILELMCSFDEDPNLFIVGDEKQAIYRFQGASLENFLYFQKLYPRAKLINLEENYRSTQALLDAAHSLMLKGAVPDALPQAVLRPRLRGKRPGGRRAVRFLEFSRPASEVSFVVSDIEERLKSGVPPREIAVLVRDNADARPFVEALEKTSVPFSVRADEDIAQDETVGKLLRILRAVREPGNEKLFAEMLHLEFLGVPPLSLYELLRFCRTNRVSLFAVLKNGALWRKAKIREGGQMLRVLRDFERWARLARNAGAGEAVETIARESGFVRTLLSERGSLRSLERLDALFAHLKALAAHRRVFRLQDFLETLARLQKHGLRLSGKSARPEFYDSISLMTAHRAKGLEFDVVYIIGATDGHWGGRRSRSDFYIPFSKGGAKSRGRELSPLKKGAPSPSEKGSGGLSPLTRGALRPPVGAGVLQPPAHRDVSAPLLKGDAENEDERRLFYVALTRARKEAVITLAREGEGGRQKLPSQFVEDIEPKLLHREDTAALEARLARRAPLYLKPKINAGPSVTFKEYLRNVFLEQGLTVTALNNYLSCPWKYFFKNLVRLPQLPEPYLLYGTAAHEALHAFFNRYKGRKVGKSALLKFFDAALEKSPLPLREYEDYRARGRAALSGYFDARKKDFVRATLNEYEITGVFLPLDVSLSSPPPSLSSPRKRGSSLDSRFHGNDKNHIQLLLRGKLDKIERNKDGTVTAVDYKTGRQKSRAEILGETKSSDGNLKRQLDFYKLLLQGSFAGSPRCNLKSGKRLRLGEMATGVIDFIEPDAKGKYHREVFEMTGRDAARAAGEAIRVGKEIYDFAFWNRRCNNRNCEYCLLRQHLP
ncbi:MAG: ATP-dependent DNA helicase [Patescibacteria group bacterium]